MVGNTARCRSMVLTGPAVQRCGAARRSWRYSRGGQDRPGGGSACRPGLLVEVEAGCMAEEVVDEQSHAGREQRAGGYQHDEVHLDLQLRVEIAHAHDARSE